MATGADVRPPLADVFPGEGIALSTGEVLTVRPLSAYAVVHEVPALIGRLMEKLAPMRETLAAGEGQSGQILSAAAPEIAALVCHVTGLPRERIDKPPPEGIWGEELMDLSLAFLRQNRPFFGKLSSLLAFARAELGQSGRGFSSSLSGRDSESTS